MTSEPITENATPDAPGVIRKGALVVLTSTNCSTTGVLLEDARAPGRWALRTLLVDGRRFRSEGRLAAVAPTLGPDVDDAAADSTPRPRRVTRWLRALTSRTSKGSLS